METLVQAIQNNKDIIVVITALLAVIISFISIVLAVITAWQQRRHNFKSVMPLAVINLSDYLDMISVEVQNNGIGPLIIKEVFVFNRDDGEHRDSVLAWLSDLKTDYTFDTFSIHLKDRVIAPNHAVVLLKLSGDIDDSDFIEARNEVRSALSKLVLIIKYEDIYGRKMEPAIRTMEWFGRKTYHENGESP